MHRLIRRAVLASAVGAAVALFGAAPAGAAVPLPGVVSPAPVSWTPNVFAGTSTSSVCQQWFGGSCSSAQVTSTAVVNGEVVVAGAFTQACQPGPASSGHCQPGTLVTRDDIFAYQLGTGVIDPNFTPQLDRGPAYSVAAGPNDTVYVGGAFTTVNAVSQRGIVQLNVTPGNASTDGHVVTGFTGHAGAAVYSLAYNANALYVGGLFTTVDSTTETGIARLNATTGAVDSTFGISVSNPVVVNGTALPLKVAALSLSADGKTLAIAGTFTKVSGFSATRVALISTGGGLGSPAAVEDWAAPVLVNNCSHQHDYVRGIDISPDGSYLVIADTGYKSDGSTNPAVCDAVARFPTAAAGPNIAPAWIDYSGGDSTYSVQATGAVVYAGGHNRWLNNECGNNAACEANSVLVMGFAAIDANTGLAVPWFHPMTTRGQGVMSLTAFPAGQFAGSNGGVLLGDDVTLNGGGQYHSFNAMFPLASTASSPAFGSIPSGMFLTGRLGGSDESTAGVAAMCLDDPGDSSAPGTAVDVSTCTNGAGQNWTVPPGNIITVNGLCLDTSGSKVVVDTCSGATSQQWTQGTGNKLVNQASGLCLDDPMSSTKNGTALDMATCTGGSNQVWPLPAAPTPSSLTPAGPVAASVPSGTAQPACLNDTGDSTTPGTLVELWTCYDNQAQHASIEANNTIQIQGLCLDTSSGHVTLNTCSGASSQVWTPSTGHTLVNQASGLCLNAPSQANGTDLTTATCSPTNKNQQWWLPAV
jgi:hypothetical protein